MKTQTLVQDGAQIVRVVTLRKGDVYKRLTRATYAGSSDELLFGYVTDVMNNGETVAVTAIELKVEYSTVTVTQKVFAGDADVTLFPATPEEFELFRQDVIKTMDRRVTDAEKALDDAENKRRLVAGMLIDVAQIGTATTTVHGGIES